MSLVKSSNHIYLKYDHKSLRKIRRKAGKTVGAVAQEFLVLIIEDEMDRQLEIITQWQGMNTFRLRWDFIPLTM